MNYEHIGSLQLCMNTYLQEKHIAGQIMMEKKYISLSHHSLSQCLCAYVCMYTYVYSECIYILYACMQVCGYGWALVSVHLSLCMRTEQMHTYNIKHRYFMPFSVRMCGWVGGWVHLCLCNCVCVCLRIAQMHAAAANADLQTHACVQMMHVHHTYPKTSIFMMWDTLFHPYPRKRVSYL